MALHAGGGGECSSNQALRAFTYSLLVGSRGI